MIRKVIENFCDEIKEDYCLFLYNKGNEILYPYCCRLSADIITSFLKRVCSDKFQYISTTRPRVYNHAWTYYNDGEEEFIVDFTQIQYRQDCTRIKDRSVSIAELKQIVENQQIVFNVEDNYMFGLDYMMPKEQKCFGLFYDFKGCLNKKDFIRYLKDNYNVVNENTNY